MRSVSKRRAARAALGYCLTALVTVRCLGTWCVEQGPYDFRDPEYAAKLHKLRRFHQSAPDRPLTLFLGSSRTSSGIIPQLVGDRAFNFGMTGGGPIFQLMIYRRLHSESFPLDTVVVEYWPPFLYEEGQYHESNRIDPLRLSDEDWPTISDYFSNPDSVHDSWRVRRLRPWSTQRTTLLNRFCPDVLPSLQRTDARWRTIDDQGWLERRTELRPEDRLRAQTSAKEYYGTLFASYQVSPSADRALHALISEVKSRQARVVLVLLPESAAFRALAPPKAEVQIQEHLARLRDEKFLILDHRTSLSDDQLPDGFHLLPEGAEEFSRSLGRDLRQPVR